MIADDQVILYYLVLDTSYRVLLTVICDIYYNGYEGTPILLRKVAHTIEDEEWSFERMVTRT